MRPSHILVLLVLLGPLAVGAGCASPLATSRDTLLGESGSPNTVLYGGEDLSKSIQNAAKNLVGKGYSPEKARERFAEASNQFQQAFRVQGDQRVDLLLEAAKGFKNAADRWPDSAVEHDALFMAAESYFFADRYPKANEMYEQLLKKYPNSQYLDVIDARRFSIAQYWLELDKKEPQRFWEFNLTDKSRPVRSTFGHAVRIFDRIRIDDPTGKLADDATLAAGNAYFACAKYMDADSFYSDLRKTFPSSEHQFRAHLLGIKAKLLSYDGPDYSGDPLDEAEKLIKQVRRQFPYEAAKEREYLARAWAEVRFKKAEREWHMAQFYDRRGEYGAARFYYQLVVNDYADTVFAEKARSRMEAIRSEPDTPPQRLEWLVKLFPQQDDVKPMIATSNSDTRLR